jgi:hypothetical protein
MKKADEAPIYVLPPPMAARGGFGRSENAGTLSSATLVDSSRTVPVESLSLGPETHLSRQTLQRLADLDIRSFFAGGRGHCAQLPQSHSFKSKLSSYLF